MINISALVSPKIEKFILFRVITYHIHTKMAKKYEFHAFGAFFCPLRLFLALFLWLGSGSKTFLEITYVDNQLPIFSLLIQPNLGPFGTFGAFQSYFWGWSQVQNLFWELLIYTNNFFSSVALSCFFETSLWVSRQNAKKTTKCKSAKMQIRQIANETKCKSDKMQIRQNANET